MKLSGAVAQHLSHPSSVPASTRASTGRNSTGLMYAQALH